MRCTPTAWTWPPPGPNCCGSAPASTPAATLPRRCGPWGIEIDDIRRSEEAFGAYPKADNADVLAYGVMNLAIYAVSLAYRLFGCCISARFGRLD
jgi:hypothetical protein